MFGPEHSERAQKRNREVLAAAIGNIPVEQRAEAIGAILLSACGRNRADMIADDIKAQVNGKN